MEMQESNRLSLLTTNDSTSTSTYRPRKRPKSIVIVHSEDTSTKRDCSRLEKFLILMLSLMLVFCLALLCLYLNERKLTEKLKQSSNTTQSLELNHSKYTANSCWTKYCIQTSVDLLSSLDPKVNPCNDFYQYVCGKWLDKNPSIADVYRWDQFEKLKRQTDKFMKNLIVDKTIRATYSRNTAVVKALQYYDSCMNEAEIERLKGTPLKQLLKKYGSWAVIDNTWNESAWEFQSAFIKAHRELDSSPFISVYVDLDMKNTSTNVINIDYSFLSLSTFGFLSNGTMYEQVRAALKEMMFNLSQVLGGDEKSMKQMIEVFEFEKELSKIYPAKGQDIKTRYRKLTIKELQKKTGKEINWLEFFKGMFADTRFNINENQEIVVFALDYLQQLCKILARTPKRLLSNFMMWRVVKKQYHQLSHDYIDIYKNFLIRAFKYSDKKARQDVCMEKLNNHFSLPISRIYADKRFDKHSKNLAKEIIENIRKAFMGNVWQVDWMDDDTKKAAINKAKALIEEVGYPEGTMNDKALDSMYEEVKVNSKTYFMNEMSLRKNAILRGLQKIGKPVDFGDWPFPAFASNAYYSYNFNQMVFPAGMFQPPFYNSKFSRAVNYGGIGTIMAHEITHGFDDTGKNFNKNGDYVKWWTDYALVNFQNKSQCLIDQYSNYAFNGHKLNGKITLSENMADNGGLKQAFKAYKNWVKVHGEEPKLPGMMLTNEQVFFIAFARNWCGYVDPVRTMILMQYDVYPPLPWRVNGTLMNSLDFAKTFNCPVGSPMNPGKKCHVW